MRAIHRKLLRDFVHLKGQVIAIGLVMACGVATFVMSLSMIESLTRTMDTYYEQSRFAEVFVHLKRAPQQLADRIATIPGVETVQTRVVERVTLDMPDMAAPATGQIVSLPADPRSGLNQLYLRSGRFPVGRHSREVLISQRFAEAHSLQTGDTVDAVLNGRLESLRIVGVALSPEFVYLIPPGSVFPENERYAIIWMDRDAMEAAFDMDGAFNDALLQLMPGAVEADVIDRVDALTESYGGLGAYGRDDQISHKFLANEIRELRGMTLIVPMIFLGVAAFLLNIVLSRVIRAQREQIAALKALGYSNLEIGWHYYSFVLLITVLSVIAGTAGGAWMGRGLTAMYIEFFNFPTFDYVLPPRVILFAFLVSAAIASIGVAHSLRHAMRLPPAEAMRPEAPTSFRQTLFERAGMHRIFGTSLRMVLRYLERRPLATAMSIFGIALATAILVVGSYSEDAIDYVIDFQFNRVQRFDIDVALNDTTDETALSTIRHMHGVRAVEPYRALSTRIHNGHRHRRVGILGLHRSDGMHRLLDMNGETVKLPEVGIVLSRMLGRALNVSVGDSVTVEVLEGRRPTLTVPVTGFIDEFSGLSAYMNMRDINQQMREQNSMSGVYVLADASHLDALYQELHEAPQVAAMNVKSATVRSFRETIAQNIGLMRTFLIGFSVVIAFGVLYNSARISLSERSRDLATLRIIGFTRREVSIIQLGELAILTGLAIPLGLALGYVLSWLTSMSSSSELFQIPFVIYPSTFVLAAVVITIASIVSGVIVRMRIDKLDLIAVLKARE